jgi:hypothetical protein
VQLQKALLCKVLCERGTPTQQAFKKPAETWVEILKQRGELFVFTRHKLRYTT